MASNSHVQTGEIVSGHIDAPDVRESRVSPSAAWLPIGLGLALTAYMLFSPTTRVAPGAALVVGALPVVLLSVTWLSRGRIVRWLLTPAGLMLGYLWACVLGVPLLWHLGLATPWPTVSGEDGGALVARSIVGVAMIQLGVHFGPRSVSVARSLRVGHSGAAAIVACICVCLAALTYISLQTGGLLLLLDNLLSRRDILSGLGPATGLAAVAAVATLATLQASTIPLSVRVLGAASGLVYLTYLYFLGSRFPMLGFLLACIIAWAATRGRVPGKALALLAVAIIPFSLWYSVAVRRGQILEEAAGGGVTASLHRLVDPFVYGGADVLNTAAATMASPLPLFGFDASVVIGNVATAIPRSVWPDKPSGFSIVFSETYFPAEWSRGSGVPPSILAEHMHTFGEIGSLLTLFLLGVLISIVGRKFMASRNLFLRLFYPFFTVDCIVLAKSGTDAFLQQVTIHSVAVGVFLLVWVLFGGRSRVLRVEKSGA